MPADSYSSYEQVRDLIHRHGFIEHIHDQGHFPHEHRQIDYTVLEETIKPDGTRVIHKAKVLGWSDG